MHVLHDLLIEAKICHQLLELAILFLEPLQATQLADAEPGIQLLPAVKSLLGNPHSAVDLGDRRTRLGLL